MVLNRLKTSSRTALGWALLRTFRGMESLLPPRALRILLWPVAVLVALAERRGDLPIDARGWRARANFHLVRALDFIPDCLAEQPWRNRCQFDFMTGKDELAPSDSPIILATLHFGPLFSLRYWLRSRGYALTTLIEGEVAQRNPIKRFKDRLSDEASGLADVPHVVSAQHLFGLRACLQPRRVLMISVDHHRGRQLEVNGPEVGFRMATGAIRIAARARAKLIPCLIAETSPWEFTIHFGRPVPAELLEDSERTARHLLNEFMPVLKRHPDQWGAELGACFRQTFESQPVPVPCPS